MGTEGGWIQLAGGKAASSLAAPSCYYFSQVLGLLQMYGTFSLSLTFRRCYKEKTFTCNGIDCLFVFLPLLSELMEFRRKLFLAKQRMKSVGHPS